MHKRMIVRCVWLGMLVLPGFVMATESGSGIPFETAMDAAIKTVYVVLAIMSVVTLALILYFFAILRRRAVVPEPFRTELIEKLRSGSLEDARRICSFRGGPLSAVILAALEHIKNVPAADAMLLRDVVEAEGARQSESMEGQTQFLMDVAVVAPMVGLLGTVFGMMLAFNAVSGEIAVVRPTALVAGVNKAMLTTAFGLVVGIPAMAFYAYFRRRAANLVSLLEVNASEMLMLLLSRRPSA